MRFDVLNLILGWTLVALTIPLLLCVIATGYLDDWELAFRAFSIPAGLSLFIGSIMLRFGTKRNTHMRLRDREAFAAVALVWPLAVFIGALPYWLGGVFHGPFTLVRIHVWIFNNGSNRHLDIYESKLLTRHGLYQFTTTWTVVLALFDPVVWWYGNHYARNDDFITCYWWRHGTGTS